MKQLVCAGVIMLLVATASATPYVVYSNDFTTTDGVTVRPNDPNNPTTGPYLEDGGVWAHVPMDSTGYQVMDVQMIDLQDPNAFDFTYGDFTIILQIEGDWLIPDETQGFWLRIYSRRWDEGAGQWAFSGSRNFFFNVEHTSVGGGFGPGWQTFTRNIDDWDEDNGWGPFDPSQVYKFRIDCINWSPDITPYRFGITDFTFIAPECPNDLDGDDDIDLGDLAILLANYGCAPVPPTTVWSSGGFEAYAPGDLVGQDNWQDDTSDPNYGVVQIVSDPTGAGMGAVMMIDPPGTGGGWLGAYRPLASPPTERYVVIEWDQYRTGLTDNVWYADSLAWDGWWAMQWDANGQASSYYFDFGVALTAGVWQHVTYVIDTVGQTATVIVDGEAYTGPSVMPDTSIDGILFEVEPTESGGADGPMYIDNLVIGESPSYFGCSAADGDYDGDGDVDLADLAIMLAEYGCGTN